MMTQSIVTQKRGIKGRTKVKTGCVTCRIRKVKCDENKPCCQKCVTTGRTCDGYESPFRLHDSRSTNKVHTRVIRPSISALQTAWSASTGMAPTDIDLLSRYFSTKTLFNVDLGCNEEARQVFQASLTDPSIRHAVMSLKALREELETFGDSPETLVLRAPTNDYGLQHYGMALRGLASKLSSPNSGELKSALICCQVLISIEQVRGNFATMALHIVRGLGIMRVFRARPYFTTTDELSPAHHNQLPFLDVFIVKLFAAPCKFAELSEPIDPNQRTPSTCSTLPPRQVNESRDLPKIAPNMRKRLVKVATLILEFLSKVSQVESIENALRLLSEKEALLDSLESWLEDLEILNAELLGHESIAVCFMRFFHLILKIVILGVLNSSPELEAELQTENEQLQLVANNVTERVRSFRICG